MISGTREFAGGLPRGAIALAGAMLLLFTLAAAAQDAKPVPPAPAAAPVSRPGMLDSMGRWFRDSFGFVSSNVEGARDAVSGMGQRSVAATKGAASAASDAATGAASAAGDAAKGAANVASDAAKGAVGAVARLPGARAVKGREYCITAPNGAPDCRQAAEAICRANGFASGSSLDIQSAKECPLEVLISRRQEKGACKVQSYVTQAMCQ